MCLSLKTRVVTLGNFLLAITLGGCVGDLAIASTSPSFLHPAGKFVSFKRISTDREFSISSEVAGRVLAQAGSKLIATYRMIVFENPDFILKILVKASKIRKE